ncbi:hypothetical protein CJJ07_003669 [Candidozyma auris]|nr:hypothetical protein CJJ07_003669 [[Candida] auris]QEL58318.1 hypothetical protein CJJ09_000354 [[Candida] auris]
MINVFRPSFADPTSSIPAYRFETSESLTRDVHIKPIHSHNDYWRKRPLLDALSWGVVSVEGDIWHFNETYTVSDTVTETTQEFKKNEIYVGHNQVYLAPQNTLNSLYLDPLYYFLEGANKEFSVPILEKFDSKFSVFYDAPEVPLFFWLDLKTEGHELYDKLKPYLDRFIKKNYLARYDSANNKHLDGPIVLTLTGDVPWDMIDQESQSGQTRYVYADCPLQNFSDETSDEDWKRYERSCKLASASLQQLLGEDLYKSAVRGDLKEAHQNKLKSYFDKAHEHNIKTRIWGGVDWPIYVRDSHWKTLWSLGCDLINADDLKAAATLF